MTCYVIMFQVDCLWSDWSKTGKCTKSCGGGVQYFERMILVESKNSGQSWKVRAMVRQHLQQIEGHVRPTTTPHRFQELSATALSHEIGQRL